MWLFVPLVVLALAQFVYWFITRHFNFFKDRNIAYRKPTLLFGNLKESALRKRFIGHILHEIYEEFPNEKVVGIFRMTSPAYLIRDPDIIKQIFIKDFNLFADRGVEFSKTGLGQNLFHADGDTWRVLRTKFTPIFTSGKLKNMFHLITNCGDKFIEHIEETRLKEPEFKFLQLSRRFTTSSIAACAFGIDIDYNNSGLEILRNFDSQILENRSRTVELDFMFPGILKLFKTSIFPAPVTNFFFDLVKTISKERANRPVTRNDFMDLILEMKQQKVVHSKRNTDTEMTLELTDQIIAAQAFIFYIAGLETSSTTSAFLMFELMKNPDIQQKVVDEIDSTLQKHGGKLTYDALSEMTYLSKVFDETLRKHPIIDPLIRVASQDYKIPGTDITIEKGRTVTFSVLGLHRDEKYYKNPEKFDPERFSPENASKIPACCYIPFGDGPRNCIGMRFGKLQTKYLVARLLAHFTVEPAGVLPDKIKTAGNKLIMAPADGVPVKISPRR